MPCERWLIEGRVQGVGYRAWMRDKAGALAVEGWVRNRHDGSVEAQVSADRLSLSRLHEACLRGPPLAAVERIIVADDGDAPADGSGFSQRPSA